MLQVTGYPAGDALGFVGFRASRVEVLKAHPDQRIIRFSGEGRQIAVIVDREASEGLAGVFSGSFGLLGEDSPTHVEYVVPNAA